MTGMPGISGEYDWFFSGARDPAAKTKHAEPVEPKAGVVGPDAPRPGPETRRAEPGEAKGYGAMPGHGGHGAGMPGMGGYGGEGMMPGYGGMGGYGLMGGAAAKKGIDMKSEYAKRQEEKEKREGAAEPRKAGGMPGSMSGMAGADEEYMYMRGSPSPAAQERRIKELERKLDEVLRTLRKMAGPDVPPRATSGSSPSPDPSDYSPIPKP